MDERSEHVTAGRLLARMDGELPAGAEAEVDAHLEECPECRDRLSELRGTADLVHRELSALDVEPPDTDPEALRERARSRQPSAPDRESGGSWGRVAGRGVVLKAALVLLTVTAGAAVVPGSPVRDWVVERVRPLLTGDRTVQEEPVRSATARPGGSVSIPVVDRAVVQIEGAPPGLAVRVRTANDGRLTVISRAARFETGAGSVEVIGPAGPELVVELPENVASARISAGGRLLLQRERGRLRVHVPADTTETGMVLRLGTPDGAD